MVDPHNDPMIFPAGTVCPFQVTVADVDTNATGKVYDNGTIKGTGRLFTSITNDLTGEGVVRNISGPGQIYTD
jgi:hypothetical protein